MDGSLFFIASSEIRVLLATNNPSSITTITSNNQSGGKPGAGDKPRAKKRGSFDPLSINQSFAAWRKAIWPPTAAVRRHRRSFEEMQAFHAKITSTMPN
jgi:hypothetical protein